jgi:hypothetical protein
MKNQRYELCIAAAGVAALRLATAGAHAEGSDLHITDGSTSSSTVTRAQGHAESREATRRDLVAMGKSDAPLATAAKKTPEPRPTTDGPYSAAFGCSQRREPVADQTLRPQSCRF